MRVIAFPHGSSMIYIYIYFFLYFSANGTLGIFANNIYISASEHRGQVTLNI